MMKDFPILTLKPDDADKNLPTIGWQPAVAELVSQRA